MHSGSNSNGFIVHILKPTAETGGTVNTRPYMDLYMHMWIMHARILCFTGYIYVAYSFDA